MSFLLFLAFVKHFSSKIFFVDVFAHGCGHFCTVAGDAPAAAVHPQIWYTPLSPPHSRAAHSSTLSTYCYHRSIKTPTGNKDDDKREVDREM
jgi:hypothetical protein